MTANPTNNNANENGSTEEAQENRNLSEHLVIAKVKKGLKREGISMGQLPQDMIVVQGLVGDSERGSDYRRLYPTIKLNICLEFCLDDMVAYHDFQSPDSPMLVRPMVIWLKPGAKLAYMSAPAASVQRTFLRGGIAEAFRPANFQGFSAPIVGDAAAGSAGCGTVAVGVCGATPTSQACESLPNC